MEQSARDLVRNGVKRNEVVLSMTVRLVRPVELAQIARTAGFDSLHIDLEHSSFSLDTAGQICMAGLATGITPLVRLSSTAPETIARVLDGGALGVIAPHIQSPRRSAYCSCRKISAVRRALVHWGDAAPPIPLLRQRRNFRGAE